MKLLFVTKVLLPFQLDPHILQKVSHQAPKSIFFSQGNRIFTEFKDALTEQYVLQELILDHEPFYYSKPNSQQEIDFIIQSGGQIIPIEVKAEENLKSRSLKQFVSDQNSSIACRFSMSNYRQEEWLPDIPLYAVENI